MSYMLLFFVSLVSGLLVFWNQKLIKPWIPHLLSFSGAYLLSICFLHLLPDLFQGTAGSIGLFILIGFFLQLILDYFSGGIEHGHTHVNKKRIGHFPFLIFLSLALHAFLEAFPIQEAGEKSSMTAYLIGLLFHKAPISFVLVSLLVAYQLKKSWVLFGIIAFSCIAPLGVFVGGNFKFPAAIFQNLFALSVGIILHLSTTILLENNEEHNIEWKKLSPLLLGVFMALLSMFIH
ncbi:MAG: ZIP family metal transporter [Vicingaceae bacterium]